MSREQWEATSKDYYEQEVMGLSKGLGDPDYHGHYPGDPDEQECKICQTLKAMPSGTKVNDSILESISRTYNIGGDI